MEAGKGYMAQAFRCRKSRLSGEVWIPGSKSHTVRAVIIAGLAAGESRIEAPLDSADTRSTARVCAGLGAQVELAPEVWTVVGHDGQPRAPDDVLDAGNSGTTIRFAAGSAALLREGAAVFTGDEQIRRRPMGPLLDSLNDLGAQAFSTRDNGCAPIVVRGRLQGGETTIEAETSQYLTSLLLNAPLAEGDTVVHVPLLNEKPYVELTLDWLQRQGIRCEHEGLKEFRIPGGQHYQPVHGRVPGDFSSATFFLCAGALSDNDVTCRGLDLNDAQGDKAVVGYLQQMGAEVQVSDEAIRVRPGELHGVDLDLNDTPDALPMMAVLGCFARGTTRLLNVPQARIKETDRIAAMRAELGKLGARVEELPDGLVIHESRLSGAEVNGYGDHRIVMALAVAGLACPGETIVGTAEAAGVTFPTFAKCIRNLGGELEVLAD